MLTIVLSEDCIISKHKLLNEGKNQEIPAMGNKNFYFHHVHGISFRQAVSAVDVREAAC